MSRYNKKEAQKRLKEAEPWLLESNEAPMHILRKYRKQFHLNNTTAVRDLKAFGIRFTTEQLNALHAEKKHGTRVSTQYDSDETFAYIAGYTSWGFPYGVTWKELEKEPDVSMDQAYVPDIVTSDDLPF